MLDHDNALAHNPLGPDDVVVKFNGRKGVLGQKQQVIRDDFTSGSIESRLGLCCELQKPTTTFYGCRLLFCLLKKATAAWMKKD